MENVRLLTNEEKPPSCYEKMGTSMGFKQLTTGNILWKELFWNLWIEEDTFFTVPVKTYLDLEIIQRYNEKLLLLSFANVLSNKHSTAQVIKFSIKDFCSKCDQIRRELRIWSHLLEKSLMENVIFCAVFYAIWNIYHGRLRTS